MTTNDARQRVKPFCAECHHARHVHATAESDWVGCRVLGCSCAGWKEPEKLHEPINAGPEDEDDWRVCGTCGTDLYGLGVCPDAPIAACGCPEYMVRTGDHMPGLCGEEG